MEPINRQYIKQALKVDKVMDADRWTYKVRSLTNKGKKSPFFSVCVLAMMLMGATLLSTGPAGNPIKNKHRGNIPLFPDATKDTSSKNDGTWLKASGRGDTYARIDSILGGTGTAVETPDCAHPDFGPHITEEFDKELQKYVFCFFIHVAPDNDRCKGFDRQRVEIKTYGKSPDSLKAFKGNTMNLRWEFKLDGGFQPSSDFTHLHQIKAADGDAGIPLITLTARRNATGDQLELIHVDSKGRRSVLTTVPLQPFKGIWVEAEEKLVFGSQGSYQIRIVSVKNKKVLLTYTKKQIDLWRDKTTFCRPKWGIYRSLHHPGALRDEKVLFADFWIKK